MQQKAQTIEIFTFHGRFSTELNLKIIFECEIIQIHQQSWSFVTKNTTTLKGLKGNVPNFIRISNIPPSVFIFITPSLLEDTPVPPVLIAPLFAIFVLREALSVGNTRKKKRRKGRRGMEESEGRRKIYSQPSPVRSSSPLHSGEHFATVSVTRCTFLLARVLAYSLSFSLFFSSSSSSIHDAHCASSVAANEPRPLSCQECNFCDDFSSKKWISFINQLIYLIIAWNDIYLPFTLFPQEQGWSKLPKWINSYFIFAIQ